MSSKPLKPEQYAAIQLLVQPKNNGFTLDEIADSVAFTRQRLYRWCQNINFNDEIKR
ncbi:hypothetical protein IOC57_11850 [Bacillus sp. SD075]|uniref:phBC6A51 family helix-turn-helix protein n=1 Tax=Bacillus sp. SD075 TaxID=2781732 RepID=UPI001A96FC42|nr:phBC6A51 family helix-turn-helix protein [Bacillus sp. SD075]MBO0998438.1 hypothetical protein [Bacillus sp. SD075]